VPVWRSLPRGFLVSRKYRVEAEVGRGGMASVYRCTGASQVRAGEVVAVKVPAPWLMADAEACRRFVQEIEVSLRLSEGRHAAIVRTLGYEIFDDPHASGRELYGLVLEYIDGLSLAQFLAQRQAKNKPLEPKEIVHILKPLCEALAYAHAQGVCHRDVKPLNVMFAKGGHAKLMDFGIARVLEDGRATLMGQADVGTPVYMPPDRDFDVRSDIYLLGNLLLELLTFDPRGDVEARIDCPPRLDRTGGRLHESPQGEAPAERPRLPDAPGRTHDGASPASAANCARAPPADKGSWFAEGDRHLPAHEAGPGIRRHLLDGRPRKPDAGAGSARLLHGGVPGYAGAVAGCHGVVIPAGSRVTAAGLGNSRVGSNPSPTPISTSSQSSACRGTTCRSSLIG